MSLGTDFISGFNATSGAINDYKDRKKQDEFERARQQLIEDKLLEDARQHQLTRQALRQNEIEKNNRFLAGQRAEEGKAAALAADPREQLEITRAKIALEKTMNPPPPSPEEKMQEDIARMRLEDEHARLMGTKPAPAPTAKIRRLSGPAARASPNSTPLSISCPRSCRPVPLRPTNLPTPVALRTSTRLSQPNPPRSRVATGDAGSQI